MNKRQVGNSPIKQALANRLQSRHAIDFVGLAGFDRISTVATSMPSFSSIDKRNIRRGRSITRLPSTARLVAKL